MKKNLENKRVAILTENGFEEIELTSPKKALEDAGITVEIVSSSKNKTVRGWKDGNWSIQVPVDRSIEEVRPDEYDALMIPGGVMNPDKMRKQDAFVQFTKGFMESGKPVASICHGPQLLIETGLLKGRKMTSAPAVQTDLKNAGADWMDREVVTDQGLVTSRGPQDLEAFNKKMLEEIREGIHETA